MGNSVKNILISGVGGQGSVTMSRIIATAASLAGFDVKVGELYGAAQRGGPVTSHVRIGKKVYTPMIPKHEADIVVSLELNETLRVVDYMNPETLVIVNDYAIYPPSVLSGVAKYPSKEEIESVLSKITKRVYFVPAAIYAIRQFKNVLLANSILLGVLATLWDLNVKEEHFSQAIEQVVKKEYIDINKKALKLGREIAQGFKRTTEYEGEK